MSQVTGQAERCVLVAEDNAALAAVVRFHLERAGLHVDHARNGRDAWNLLQTRDYAVLVTDQQMPELSGTEICARMRQDPRLAQMPVVMVTAKSLELELSKLRDELGVREVLPKPFSVCQLLETVQGCVASL